MPVLKLFTTPTSLLGLGLSFLMACTAATAEDVDSEAGAFSVSAPRSVTARARTTIAKTIAVREETMTDAQPLLDIESGSNDNLFFTEVLLALEEEFGIEITDEEWDRVATVGDAIRLILRRT